MPDKPDRQPPDRRLTVEDDDGQTRRRYTIGARKIRPEDRDVSGPVLRGPHARYRDIMRSNDDDRVPLGADTAFDAYLTDSEVEAFRGASNIRYVEEDRLIPPAAVVNPPAATLSWMGASLAQQGTYTGAGVKVAVLDGGTTPAMRAQMSWTMVAKKVFPANVPPGTENMGGHGCLVASEAVPPTGQLLDAMIAAYPDGSAYGSDMAAGLIWAADNAAKVANLSFGAFGPGIDQVMRDAMGYCRDRGVQVTVAAGNDGQNGIASPAIGTREFPNVHAIGAVDPATNQIASFSNRNQDLSGVLPGVNQQGVDTTGAVVTWAGTSSAAPKAALLIAMLATGSVYTPQQAANALRSTARDLGLGVAVQGRGAWHLANAKTQLAADAVAPLEKHMFAVLTADQWILPSTYTRVKFPLIKEIESTNPKVTLNENKDVFTVNVTGRYLITTGFRWIGHTEGPGDRFVAIGPNIPWNSTGGRLWKAWSEKGSTTPLGAGLAHTQKFTAGEQFCVWAWQSAPYSWGWALTSVAAHADNECTNVTVDYLGA